MSQGPLRSSWKMSSRRHGFHFFFLFHKIHVHSRGMSGQAWFCQWDTHSEGHLGRTHGKCNICGNVLESDLGAGVRVVI